MQRPHLLFLSVAFFLGSFTATQAAIIPRFSAEELVARSEQIAEGTVTRSWTAWDSKHVYIWTHYEITVKDMIRGQQAKTIVVSEPGGSLDGISQRISGVTPQAIGETSVLFLYKTPIGYWRLRGGPQGKFALTADGHIHLASGSAVYVDRPRRAASPVQATALGKMENLSLAEFKSKIRGLSASHPYQESK